MSQLQLITELEQESQQSVGVILLCPLPGSCFLRELFAHLFATSVCVPPPPQAGISDSLRRHRYLSTWSELSWEVAAFLKPYRKLDNDTPKESTIYNTLKCLLVPTL